LRDGVTFDQSQADLGSITARLSEQYPVTNTGLGAKAYPLLDDTVRMYRAVLLLLMAAVAFVLLIACANVANLMLVRASGRFKEMAIRSALGASRWRISRQLLIESVLLATAGGALGVLFGSWGIALMGSFIPASDFKFIPGFSDIGINLQVLGFTLAISIATGLLFGLAPAWHSSRTSLSDALKEGGRQSGAASGRNWLRGLLVVSEIALSVVLLVGAGLMVKSFWMLTRTNPGFNPDSILTMGLSLTGERYRQEQPVFTFYRDLVERVRNLPGVNAAAVVNYLPLGGSNSSSSFLIEGVPEPPPGQEFGGRYRVCSPDYFSTMGINVLRGRAFTEQDTADSKPVIIVSDTLARRYWPDQDAVGKRMRFTGPIASNPWMEVVGVVNDVKHQLDKEFTSDYYLPHAQDSWSVMMLVARTSSEPMALAEPVRGEVQSLDANQPVFDVKAMKQVRAQSMLMYTVSGTWMSIFAGIALVLAAVGLYGVMSYTVGQRTHEIGVRMALGAKSGDVVRMVMRQGLVLIAIGLTIGLAGSIALTSVISSLLFGAAGGNAGALAAMAAFLTAVALFACYVPARRATKVDPMIALRYE
jgi:putative ABC transport system permease protein